MYEAENISLQAGSTFIVKNVNLAVSPGEFTAVIGPNGAGKSSLLKIMSNERHQYAGKVSVNGTAIKDYKPKELARIRAVMAQHSGLQFAFSVNQVISLARHGHLSGKKEDQRIIEEVMEVTGVRIFQDRNYLTLSGGEKQRVQLARALAQVWEETLFPRYILLDEPTSSMDIAQQQFMFNLVKKVCSRNIGVLAIVHDLNLAVQFADQVCLMREGEVIVAGNAREVFTKVNIENTFCCKVNIYHDPCNRCPIIIPQTEDSFLTNISITK
jgi:iron complex transport system ATP-binding protein